MPCGPRATVIIALSLLHYTHAIDERFLSFEQVAPDMGTSRDFIPPHYIGGPTFSSTTIRDIQISRLLTPIATALYTDIIASMHQAAAKACPAGSQATAKTGVVLADLNISSALFKLPRSDRPAFVSTVPTEPPPSTVPEITEGCTCAPGFAATDRTYTTSLCASMPGLCEFRELLRHYSCEMDWIQGRKYDPHAKHNAECLAGRQHSDFGLVFRDALRQGSPDIPNVQVVFGGIHFTPDEYRSVTAAVSVIHLTLLPKTTYRDVAMGLGIAVRVLDRTQPLVIVVVNSTAADTTSEDKLDTVLPILTYHIDLSMSIQISSVHVFTLGVSDVWSGVLPVQSVWMTTGTDHEVPTQKKKACTPCNVHSYCALPDKPVPCPKGSWTKETQGSAVSEDHCLCQPGFKRNLQTKACDECGDDEYCSGEYAGVARGDGSDHWVPGFGTTSFEQFSTLTDLQESPGGFGGGDSDNEIEYATQKKFRILEERENDTAIESDFLYSDIGWDVEMTSNESDFPRRPAKLIWDTMHWEQQYNRLRWQSDIIVERRWHCRRACAQDELSLCSKGPDVPCLRGRKVLNDMGTAIRHDTFELTVSRRFTATETDTFLNRLASRLAVPRTSLSIQYMQNGTLVTRRLLQQSTLQALLQIAPPDAGGSYLTSMDSVSNVIATATDPRLLAGMTGQNVNWDSVNAVLLMDNSAVKNEIASVTPPEPPAQVETTPVPAEPLASDKDKKDSGGLSPGAVAGITVGALAFVGIVIGVFVYFSTAKQPLPVPTQGVQYAPVAPYVPLHSPPMPPYAHMQSTRLGYVWGRA